MVPGFDTMAVDNPRITGTGIQVTKALTITFVTHFIVSFIPFQEENLSE